MVSVFRPSRPNTLTLDNTWRRWCQRYGRFGMKHTVEMIWMLLHTSVLFFFINLVYFLVFIGDKTIAWIFLGFIVAPMLMYIPTTLHPCFLLSNSHYTPFSSGVSQPHNRRFSSQPMFHIGKNSWWVDRELRDRQVTVAHHS